MITVKEVLRLRTDKSQKPHDFIFAKILSEHKLFKVNQLTEESVEAFLDGEKRQDIEEMKEFQKLPFLNPGKGQATVKALAFQEHLLLFLINDSHMVLLDVL